MARADLLIQLVRAGARGDTVQFRRTVEALAANERAKKHTVLADRLLRSLQTENGRSARRTLEPVSSEGPPLVETTPSRQINELILSPATRRTIYEVAEEHFRSDLLRSHNLEPRHRVLLSGPPGNGKTVLAEALAYELSLPLFRVRYESVIGSYLGETSQKLARLFEQARSQHCVVFFDEFDAVGKERADLHETGEIKRVVSTLLLQIDALPSYVIVVAATNHPELLDRATWRRFQVRIELPLPTSKEIEVLIDRFQAQTKLSLPVASETLGRRLVGLSFAEVEEYCLDVLRRVVLDGESSLTASKLVTTTERWASRVTILSND